MHKEQKEMTAGSLTMRVAGGMIPSRNGSHLSTGLKKDCHILLLGNIQIFEKFKR